MANRCTFFTGMSLVLLLAVALLAGCQKKEANKKEPAARPAGQQQGLPVQIQHGAEEGKWKAVKLGITDKKLNRDFITPIDIGSTLTVPDTGLAIKVEYFFPDFIMKGGKVTSKSNNLKNPAVSVVITDNDTKDPATGKSLVLTGYLFTRIHNDALNHSRYNFVLVDGIPRQ